MGAFKGGGICPLYPQLRKESWSPLRFCLKNDWFMDATCKRNRDIIAQKYH